MVSFFDDTKGHSFCKKCLHELQFIEVRSLSPNLSKLAKADISCQFMKKRSLCRHCLQNEWTLGRLCHTFICCFSADVKQRIEMWLCSFFSFSKSVFGLSSKAMKATERPTEG